MFDFRLGAEVLARVLPQARLSVIAKARRLAPPEQPDAFRELDLDYLRQS